LTWCALNSDLKMKSAADILYGNMEARSREPLEVSKSILEEARVVVALDDSETSVVQGLEHNKYGFPILTFNCVIIGVPNYLSDSLEPGDLAVFKLPIDPASELFQNTAQVICDQKAAVNIGELIRQAKASRFGAILPTQKVIGDQPLTIEKLSWRQLKSSQ